MPEPISEDCVPLMVEEKEKSPVVVDAGSKRRGFLFQRLTYYWIVFVSQSLQISLSLVGFILATIKKAPKADNEEAWRFAASGLYSLITFVGIGVLLGCHYKKYPETGAKKATAVHHVNVAKSCVITSLINLGVLFLPVVIQYAKGDGSEDIRSIVVPINTSLFLVSALASAAAGYITYTAAKRARGSDPVVDPNYRVPAWTLATTAESNGLVEGGVHLA
ncbi:hypothetical protein GALMADRAFT_243555 [Galerina marginata CBS 339.88]|uniref:Uncharacterized protein n=1 Tax=Galerina marginata (strain CBS 339.88) TaxID=685588 RepID=A0A067THW2_GALM3|nr:hypothetical protein GALMADRAFT_243555 [Galerina marginata CBS 339.88]